MGGRRLPGRNFWIAVALVRLLAGRLCTVSSEEPIGLFFGELFFFVVIVDMTVCGRWEKRYYGNGKDEMGASLRSE
jgi:hypothetical protein